MPVPVDVLIKKADRHWDEQPWGTYKVTTRHNMNVMLDWYEDEGKLYARYGNEDSEYYSSFDMDGVFRPFAVANLKDDDPVFLDTYTPNLIALCLTEYYLNAADD